MVNIKRVYDPPAPDDGERYLVDRLWPRGLSKEMVRLTAWLKDLAPSSELRRWFDHNPERWEEFQERYAGELADAHKRGVSMETAMDGQNLGEPEGVAKLVAFLVSQEADYVRGIISTR